MLQEQSKKQAEVLLVTLKHSGLQKPAENFGCSFPLGICHALLNAKRWQRMRCAFGIAVSGWFLKQNWVITLPRST